MKYLSILLFLIIPFLYVSCDISTSTPEKKKEVLVKKWQEDENTYMIICRGWPKSSLKGKPRQESAKEAALINAQMIAGDIFSKPVDPVRNGVIEKYDIEDDYVTIHYAIKFKDVKRYLK